MSPPPLKPTPPIFATSLDRASRRAAVAAELVLVRDESGQASIECLDLARVIAATNPKAGGRSQAVDTVSLHIGDRVQILGYFRAEQHGDDHKAADRVFGMLGDKGHIQVRLLERPTQVVSDEGTGDSNAAQGSSAPAAEPDSASEPAGASEV